MAVSKAGKKIIAGLTEAVEYARNGMPREARRREGGSGPSGLASPVGEADAPELLRRISTLTDEVAELRAALLPFAELAGGDVNMNDPLRKWITVGHLWEARATLTKGEGNKP